MSSQVSNPDYTNVPLRELSIGDVILGIHNIPWGSDSKWEIIELPEDFYTAWPSFTLERITNQERLNWSAYINWVVMVENRTFKYDPRQAGDTDEDI